MAWNKEPSYEITRWRLARGDVRAAVSAVVGLALMALGAASACAQPKYDTGASDTEIKIGETMPYSGPLSITAPVGRMHQAYFKWINDNGGINGRKINLISLDDQYNPPKTVEQTRRLVESDQVLLIFGTLGTATNASVQKYLNAKKIPQLFIHATTSRFSDPKDFPYTIGFLPTARGEARQDGRYVIQYVTDPKVAILAQSGDMANDYFAGFREGLGDAADRIIVKQMTYEASDPSVDSQIEVLAASDANVLMLAATQKAAAQALRKMDAIGWRPKTIVAVTASSRTAVMQAVGFDKVQGVVATLYGKQPGDPAWDNDPAMKEYLAWHAKNFAEGNAADSSDFAAYMSAQTLAEVLRRCGDDLTRENVMRQATHLDLELGMLLPGIRLTTSPDDYELMRTRKTMEFKGSSWTPVDVK